MAVAAAVAVVGVHAALNARFPRLSDPVSYGFFLACSLCAIVNCARESIRGSLHTRLRWALAGCGFLLWFTATVLAAYAELVSHDPVNAASLDDFFYFFCGIPFLLAIVLPDDDRGLPLFLWLDGLQTAAAGYLTYVAVFSVLPLSKATALPMPVGRLVIMLNIERYTLCALSTARLAVSPRHTRERQFFSVLTTFLWVWTICESIYNHLVLQFNDAGVLDSLVDVPFLVFLIATAVINRSPAPMREGGHRKPLVIFVDQVRPVLLALTLVALSGMVAGQHFRVAMGVIVGAFAIYGVRSAMLQSRLMRTQIDLEDARDRLEELTLLDPLTGIANRRCFDQRLMMEWGRAQRTRSSLSLLMIDIDHFKDFNDTLGHLAGDECLASVAKTMQKALNRPADLLARYGGEEFVVLLPETDDRGAFRVAERLQTVLSSTRPLPGIERQVTVSIGGATLAGPGRSTAEQLLETADRALYLAKQNGRNRNEFLRMQALPPH